MTLGGDLTKYEPGKREGKGAAAAAVAVVNEQQVDV
jgi:hypothetical protein